MAMHPHLLRNALSLPFPLAYASDCSSSCIRAKNFRAPVLLNEQDSISIPARAIHGAIHARRPDRHPGHRKTQALWTLLEQPQDIRRGHMPFNHVALYQARVTRAKLLRHAKASPCRVVSRIAHRDYKIIFLQVSNPIFATTAIRIFPNLHRHRLASSRGHRGRQRPGRQCGEHGSSGQSERAIRSIHNNPSFGGSGCVSFRTGSARGRPAWLLLNQTHQLLLTGMWRRDPASVARCADGVRTGTLA